MTLLKDYRIAIVVPLALLLFSLGVLLHSYFTTGDFAQRSFELKGGTLISFVPAAAVDITALERDLQSRFGDASVRETRGVAGTSIQVQVEESVNGTQVLDFMQANGIDTSRSSVSTIGPALSQTFWRQTQGALLLAFVLIAIIVFIIFRQPMPSLYVMAAAISDIVITVAFMNVFGIELSLASLGALLMLIGYSIDTDILLTTRVTRAASDDAADIAGRVKDAFKTGITMTGTAIGAIAALYLSAASPVLSQISAVLLIGLSADIINTWLLNAVLLRWWLERRAA